MKYIFYDYVWQSREEEDVLGTTGDEMPLSVSSAKKSTSLYLLWRVSISSATSAFSMGSHGWQVKWKILKKNKQFLEILFGGTEKKIETNILMYKSRYWTPGRVGNLYSPNPGEDAGAVNTATQRLRGQERTSGWSWRRLPWSRGPSTNTGQTPDHSHRYNQSHLKNISCLRSTG